jgi:transposase
MGGHQAHAAEQAAWRSSGKRPTCSGSCNLGHPGAICRIILALTPPVYNRFVRWRRARVWGRIIDALAAPHDGAVQMTDTSIVRVHQKKIGKLDA